MSGKGGLGVRACLRGFRYTTFREMALMLGSPAFLGNKAVFTQSRMVRAATG